MTLQPVVEGSRFLVDYDAIALAAKKRNAKRIALQLPEGLRAFASEVAGKLALSTGAETMIDSEPCFGACDIPTHLFAHVELVVQFGHTEMPSIGAIPKMYFANLLLDIDPLPVVKKSLPQLSGSVGVVTTAQHVHSLDSIVSFLQDRGIAALTSRGDARLGNYAQLLGCDYTSALWIEGKVDTYLYVGDGDFHPIGLAMLTDRKLVAANPADMTVRTLDTLRDSLMKQRLAVIERAMAARSFGVLLNSKLGQRRKSLADTLVSEISAAGREAMLVHTNVVSPDLISHYSLGAFVSTACPRIAIDDYHRYPKPLLTPVEAEIAIGLKPFSAFRFDQILAEQ